MKTNALFIVLGLVGILILIVLAYGEQVIFLIFDFKWKRFWKRSRRLLSSLFRTRMKRIKGKIIRLKSKKFPMIANSSLNENVSLIQNMYNQEFSSEIIGYFVFFEEEKSHQKCFIEISKDSFEELKRKDISSLKHISLLFEKWFWGKNFHHYEIIA